MAEASEAARRALRWPLADEPDPTGQLALFDGAPVHEFGTGEFRGLEFLHVNAKSIINEVPASSRMPFRYTINAYRGCSHACVYCQSGDTAILMADGRTKPLRDVRAGDEVCGTERRGSYRRYVTTTVLDHWTTMRSAHRVTLSDGTTLIASGDHRYLSDRGWKHVTGTECDAARRPHLTTANRLLGPGGFVDGPKDDDEYRRGYLCGMVRGNAHLATQYRRPRRDETIHQFWLAL